jgi:hypothetical protein
MALPLSAANLLPRRVPLLRLAPSPQLDLEVAKIAALSSELRTVIEEMESYERIVNGSYSKIQTLAPTASQSPEGREVLEKGLEQARNQESELADLWVQVQESRERELARARELASHEPPWREYAELLDRLISSTLRVLGTLRDFRLEIAAVLTEYEDEADSPVFDDPEELKKYLESV